MNNQYQHMEWIDKFLDGKLTAGELEAFKKMQEEDASFREMVVDMRLLVNGIRSTARDSLRQEISSWEIMQPAIEPKANLRKRVMGMGWISLAAAACLAATLYIGVFRPPQSERIANSIYREYYDGAYQNTVVLSYRSDENHISGAQQAFGAYDRKEYQTAIALFSALPQKNDTVQFFLGQSFLSEKEYLKAAECFRATLESGKFMPDESRWFLAISLLKSGKTDEAKSIFGELSSYRNVYQNQALEIRSKLSTIH